jgi:GntR family transcriptional regulator, vanillate catabolism transcriptional regulator
VPRTGGGAISFSQNLHGAAFMKRAGIRASVIVDANEPRDNASQVSRATLGLREMLLRGALRPGERIAEIPLSINLGVSRTPLRLAFEKLQHEGLVKALPHTGFAASEFSLPEIWDAIETRGILEGACARLAAERLNHPAQLEPLRIINRAMEQLSDINLETFTQFLDLNTAFHEAILDLANNQILRRAVEQVYRLPFASPGSRVLVHMTLHGSKEIIPIAEEHHRVIIDAIEHREGARAEGVAREHARLTRRNLEEALADRKLLETIPGGYLIKARSADRA